MSAHQAPESDPAGRRKTSILTLQRKKQRQQPISAVTAYDVSSAQLADRAGIDLLLVGDSLGQVVLGRTSTVGVTMDEMVHHCRAVSLGARFAFRVGDLPFLSYQTDHAEAVRNAGRLLKEGGMEAVKLEGGRAMVPTVRAVADAGIAVMGHIGFTPQAVSKLGGNRVQGRTAEEARILLRDALALERAGCFAVVLEMVPSPVAAAISQRLAIPTIGIGAGAGCDGQVLVYHDLLGLQDEFTPRFLKRYANLAQTVVEALGQYREDVEQRRFPASEHTYPMAQAELEDFQRHLEEVEAQDPAAVAAALGIATDS